MKLSRREALGKALRWIFVGIVAASLIEGVGGVDPETGRCDCLFCKVERALAAKIENRNRQT